MLVKDDNIAVWLNLAEIYLYSNESDVEGKVTVTDISLQPAEFALLYYLLVRSYNLVWPGHIFPLYWVGPCPI